MMRLIMEKLIHFTYYLLIFILLSACSAIPNLDPESVVEEKRTIPSKKNTVTAINPKTYHTAYQDFYDRAVKGDAVAQNNLGHMYSDGRGVPENHKEAVKWYIKAADQGNSNAMINLGMSYLHGRGVMKSKNKACKYFAHAQLAGNREGKEFFQHYCNKKPVV